MTYENNLAPRDEDKKEIISFDSSLAKRGLDIIALLEPRRLHVPKDFSSIAEAIQNAHEGDIVDIAGGIYEESLQITKPIELTGSSTDKVVLRHQNLSPICTYRVHHGISKLRNIVFQKTPTLDGSVGVNVQKAILDVENCRFEDFEYSKEYYEWWGDNIEMVNDYEPCKAIQIVGEDSRANFEDCSFVNSEWGLCAIEKARIELKKCNFYHSPLSIGAYGSLISSHSIFSKGCAANLGLDAILESNYDTFYEVEELINASSNCQAIFKNATVLSKNLLGIAIGEYLVNPEKFPVWTSGKPQFSFSNSIVIIKNGMNTCVRFAPSSLPDAKKISTISIDNFCARLDTFLAGEDVVQFNGKNIVCIPPYFNGPDPLLIFDGNQVRLRRDSPAISAACDGSNLGAWQGE